MATPLRKWSDFWEREGLAFFNIMKSSTSVFAERFDLYFKINKNHRILDFGCGPGFFIDHATAKGVNISGVDINSFFIADCKARYPGLNIFAITTDLLATKNTLDKAFAGVRFDFIVLLSVSQYFESKGELGAVIGLVRNYLAQGGHIVVADVVTQKTSPVRDLMAVFRQSVGTGNFVNFIRFLGYLVFSNYRTLSRNVSLQSYSDDDFQKIADLNNLSCSQVDNLTLHPTRSNYIMTYS